MRSFDEIQLLINIRAVVRLFLLGLCILAGLLAAGITAPASLRPKREPWAIIWFRCLLWTLNVRVRLQGEEAPAGSLLVANHISWLDILALGACGNTRFVAKSEIATWPVAGHLASVVDTVFLPRGQHQAARSAECVARYMSQGKSVVVFPEATTSGERLPAHFHARFFAASILSGKPVQPAALAYQVPGGDYQAVPYLDDRSLGASLWAVLQQPMIEVQIRHMPPIDPVRMERKALASAARESILSALGRDPVENNDIQSAA